MTYGKAKATIWVMKSNKPLWKKFWWLKVIARNYGIEIASKFEEKYLK